MCIVFILWHSQCFFGHRLSTDIRRTTTHLSPKQQRMVRFPQYHSVASWQCLQSLTGCTGPKAKVKLQAEFVFCKLGSCLGTSLGFVELIYHICGQMHVWFWEALLSQQVMFVDCSAFLEGSTQVQAHTAPKCIFVLIYCECVRMSALFLVHSHVCDII